MRSSRSGKRVSQTKKLLEDPAAFTRTLLDHDIWSKQEEILRSVAKFSRTSVKACHASGKTFIAAAAAMWWLTRHKEAVVITTAPTWTQVERVLWGEIHNMIRRSKIDYPIPAATSLRLGPSRYAIGLSTNEGVRFQGYHGNVLIILDEAPGILPQIYEAIEGIRAGGDVRVLALGNPVISSGPFYDSFSVKREGWNPITISAFDTPNLEAVTLDQLLKMSEQELDANPRPYLTTRRWVKEKFSEWGPFHPLWESRVLGNFPLQSEDSLLSLTWLEQAKLRTEGDGEVWAGVDVAGPGESETVLCVRRGPRIVVLRAWAKDDSRGEVLAALGPFKSELKGVNVDTVGIGQYFAKHLRDQRLPVKDVNVGQAARDKEKFANLKAELYWKLRLRAESGSLAGLTDDRAIAQLAAIRYSHNSRGQVVIESKDEARKRGVKSPDRAEAIMLAFAEVRTPPFGLLEYQKQEAAKLAENTGVRAAILEGRRGLW